MSLFIILISFFIKQVFLVKYLSIPFKRNLKDLTEDNIMEKLFNNDIYASIKVGSESQEIPLSFKMNSYPLYIISSDINIPGKKLYDYKKSTSFKKLDNETQTKFEEQEFNEGNKSSDKFNLGISNFKNLENIKFIHATNMNEKYIINEVGSIGLSINENLNLTDTDFIYQLKKRDLIDGYSFFFKYNDLKKEKGEIIIGAKPHEYDKNYNVSDFKSVNVEIDSYKRNHWMLNFDKIDFYNHSLLNGKCIFQIEKGLIIAPNSVKKNIEDIFKYNECEEKTFFSNEFNNSYIYFVCKQEMDIKQFSDLSFYSRSMNITFKLDNNDLFYNFNKKKYFLIIFHSKKLESNWYLGSIFLKKYDIIFDKHTKTIGTYEKFQKGWKFIYLIIILLILIIIGLIIFIVCYLLRKRRKTRVNEIDDDFDYIPHRQTMNQNNETKLI